MISVKHGFVFVHIPKTAGNALQTVLRKYSEDKIRRRDTSQDGIERFAVTSNFGTTKHSTLADYYSALGAIRLMNMFRFTCIRNPWDRAISYFFSPFRGTITWDRDAFINVLDEIKPMHNFLSFPTETPDTIPSVNMNFIMRYETLNEDFATLCDLLKIRKKKLPLRNKSNRLPYQKYYDEELIELVKTRFRQDVNIFGYAFDKTVNHRLCR